jgi:hypothetical protein
VSVALAFSSLLPRFYSAVLNKEVIQNVKADYLLNPQKAKRQNVKNVGSLCA